MGDVFAGTDRFEVRDCLGSGACGSVYEVFDRKLGAIVALKTLLRSEPSMLYSFKQEFRELADLKHPHLVTLYELLSEGDRWFFTMEMVRGLDFLAHVGVAAQAAGTASHLDSTDAADTVVGGKPPPRLSRHAAAPRPLGEDGIAKLRHTLPQLAAGVVALHRAGKLHRDLKPSNVRVDPNGRLVLLDFGLVLPLDRGADREIAGTPAYMSPEQAAGVRLSEASDWFSVGVMLFQALAGVTPFQGMEPTALLLAKRDVETPSLRHLNPAAPADLVELCHALLQREPAARPRGDEVLARLARDTGSIASERSAPFVGREAELARFERAFAATRGGRAAVVSVRGPSGIGKSSLCQHFAARVAARDAKTVVLSGRCYQQESVPFKGLDSAVDALSAFLRGLDDAEAAAIVPRDAAALGRLFPVLRRVQVIADAPRPAAMLADEIELRRRAFAALRELLRNLAERRPLVLVLDDLQWAGEDTAALLTELLQRPAPPMLVLGTWRSDDPNPVAERLAASRDLHQEAIELAPLETADARALAASILQVAAHDPILLRIADESAGSPFFVCELARHRRTAAAPAGPDTSLDEIIRARVRTLASPAQRLLRVIAVSGRPLLEHLAVRTAELGHDAAAAIAELRSAHLVSTRGSDQLEAYHDRIREAVAAAAEPAERDDIHLRIADLMGPDGNPEHILHHLLAAAQLRRAAPHAVRAAKIAETSLAFERAAELYEIALDDEGWNAAQRLELMTALGKARANAGQGARAGQTFLAAAALASGEEAQSLQNRAAGQLLMSGRIDEGIEVLRSVLREVGLHLPPSDRGALVQLVWHTARLRLRGLRYRTRTEEQVTPALLRKVDVCWTVAHGLAGASPLHSMAFAARGARLALRAGEPSRIANLLTLHATLASAIAPDRVAAELDVARDAAVASGDEYAQIFNQLARGATAYFRGQLDECVRIGGGAEAAFRERCQGVAWEILTLQSIANFARTFLGDWRYAIENVHVQVREAEQRGDLYGAATLAMALGWVRHLAADEPQAALDELDEFLRRWGERQTHYQHYYDVETRVWVRMYMGDPLGALEYLDRRWRELQAAGLFRVTVVHTLARAVRAGCLIAASYESKADRAALIARARRDVAIMRRLPFRGAVPWALHLSGCIAAAQGDREAAARMLAEAGEAMIAAGFRTGPLCGFLLRGEIVGGDEGAELAARAVDYFAAEGFRSPRRFAGLFAPGIGRQTH